MKDQLDNNRLKSKDGASMSITSEGSLGLLALGDIGLVLWRQAILKDQVVKDVIRKEKSLNHE